MSSKVLLVSSAGTGNGFATVRAIQRNFRESVKVVAIDNKESKFIPAALFSDFFYSVPLVKEEAFFESINAIIKKHRIEHYIAFFDLELVRLAEWITAKDFPDYFSTPVENVETASICFDKLKSYSFLKENGFRTPRTFDLDCNPDDYKNLDLILKPISGSASVIRDFNPYEMANVKGSKDYVIQEKCESPEITIDFVKNPKTGKHYYACRERLETKSGVCTKARFFNDEELEQLSLKLSDLLNLDFYCYQVMKLNGEWVVTDVNPRLGAGTEMGSAVGLDFFSAMIAILIGEDERPYVMKLEKEQFVCRQYDNFVTG